MTRPPFRSLQDVKADWDVFLEELGREVQASIGQRDALKMVGAAQSPYDCPAGVLKRKVYAHVCGLRGARERSLFEDVLDDDRTASLPSNNAKQPKKKAVKQIRHRKVSYKDNPFYCALKGIPEKIWKFEGSDLSRYGWQLEYANRHEIDPDLLIGFLAQSGSMRDVAQKAFADPDQREKWYTEKPPSLPPLTSVDRKKKFPLSVIAFDEVLLNDDWHPIQVGVALWRSRKSEIVYEFYLIKPDKKWGFSRPGAHEHVHAKGVSLTHLLEADAATSVFSSVLELTDRVENIYCDDLGQTSRAFQTLIDASGDDFTIPFRDIGAAFKYDTVKRAEIAKVMDRLRAQKAPFRDRVVGLCEMLRTLI